jgi:MOSC domain-containing protein YiiM
MPTLISVQTAPARRVQINGRIVLTAIHKQPVTGAVALGPLGLAGDEQADLSVHGGLDKAVYAYPSEHYAFWRAARAQAGLCAIDDALPWGSVGENLTLQGLLETEVWLGDLLEFDACGLRVTLPREPCYKFNAAMGYSGAGRDMAQQACCGFYLAVTRPGQLSQGESCSLVPGPRRVSLVESFNAKLAKHRR